MGFILVSKVATCPGPGPVKDQEILILDPRGNLAWPTAGNTETVGRRNGTTLCWGDYEVRVQGTTTDLYEVWRDI